MNHPNVQKVLDYLEVAAKKDFAKAASFYTADVEYIVAGRNRFSGAFRGTDALMGYFGKMMQLSNGTYKVIGFKDWLVSEDKALAIAEEEVTINGNYFKWIRLLLFEFTEDKKIKKVSFFDQDQYAFDDFLG